MMLKCWGALSNVWQPTSSKRWLRAQNWDEHCDQPARTKWTCNASWSAFAAITAISFCLRFERRLRRWDQVFSCHSSADPWGQGCKGWFLFLIVFRWHWVKVKDGRIGLWMGRFGTCESSSLGAEAIGGDNVERGPEGSVVLATRWPSWREDFEKSKYTRLTKRVVRAGWQLVIGRVALGTGGRHKASYPRGEIRVDSWIWLI